MEAEVEVPGGSYRCDLYSLNKKDRGDGLVRGLHVALRRWTRNPKRDSPELDSFYESVDVIVSFSDKSGRITVSSPRVPQVIDCVEFAEKAWGDGVRRVPFSGGAAESPRGAHLGWEEAVRTFNDLVNRY